MFIFPCIRLAGSLVGQRRNRITDNAATRECLTAAFRFMRSSLLWPLNSSALRLSPYQIVLSPRRALSAEKPLKGHLGSGYESGRDRLDVRLPFGRARWSLRRCFQPRPDTLDHSLVESTGISE